ncbi:MAG TPA: carboxypeptidase regulatory-like domain-containing protein [Candidatus Sulfotelmatobacter sp.]|nr:carboxypeptidase regulatory-like domain-containing protein [Candidatus Sulfotelmatobacter sp.]
MSSRFKLQLLLAGLLVASLLMTQAIAQTVTSGDLTGTVTDPSGAVVTGATLTVTSLADGSVQTITTGSTGLYRFPFLKPGEYKLAVKMKNFKTVEQDITVVVGQVTTANVKLELGAGSEVVEVTGAAPLLQTENADTSTSFTETQLKALPAPGGDITSYAYTAPGVVVSNGAGYGNFSANGLPSTSNLFTVNGNDYMDPYLNLNNSGASNLTLGSNELQEVTVVENGYTADYGRQAAAQMNAATKSGTNAFHGNATYGYNGTALNANDWFANATDPVTPRPHAVNNTYAASVGGPIVRNKLFFFVDYEALRMILPGVSGTNVIPTSQFATYVLSQVPSAEQSFYQNIFNLYAGAPGSSAATPLSVADPSVAGGCGDFSGTAGFGTGGTPCAQQFVSGANNMITEWILASSIDYDISSKDHLKGRYQMDRGVQATGTDPINAVFNATSIQPEYNGQLIETHTFNPTTFNNLIISGAWYKALFGPPSFSAAIAKFPTTIAFSGTAPPFTQLGGADNTYPQGRIVTQAQIRDNFSKVIGAHDLKIGADYRRNLVSDYSALAGTSGLLTMLSTDEFVSGVTGPAQSFYNANFTNVGAVKIKLYNVGLYMQDQWKITSKLNLTLGLRVDRTANPSCATNCFTRMNAPFEELSHDVSVPYSSVISSGLKYAFPDVEKAVFSPRFGFAYSPDTNTVIRGGFGIFDDEFPALAVDRSLTNAPAVSNFSSSGANGESLAPGVPGSVYDDAAATNATFQSQFASGLTVADLGGVGPNYFTTENKLLNPKFAEWNLEIQRQIGNKFSASINYAGNHGYDLMMVNTFLNAFCKPFVADPAPVDPNPADPGREQGCQPGQTFGGIGLTPTDPRFSEISALNNQGYSNYHGVTGSFKMKPTKGFSGQFNYTWSHGLDTCSNNCLEPFVANTLVSLRYQASPSLPGSSYGNSDYDVRHNFNLNYVYQTPSTWSSPVMKNLVGGWTIAGTMFYHTGIPWSPVNTLARGLLGNVTGLRTTTPLALFNNGTVIKSSCGRGAAQAGAGIGGAACAQSSNFVVGDPIVANAPDGTPVEVDVGGVRSFGNARNALRGPGFFNTDLSLLKNFKIAERFNFAIGATAFDILNHQNFDLPVNSVTSGLFGDILSTIGSNTNPYGAFFGVPLNGRILQLNAKVTF